MAIPSAVAAKARAHLLAAPCAGPLRRIDDYDLPVAEFCAQAIARRAAPFVLGMNGPQGAGKSTLAERLVLALSAHGLRVVAISIDDFYLTHDAQQALARAHPGNPYLEHRGYPGTHDIALGEQVLSDLLVAGEVAIPTYDKSAHQGRGDRAPISAWRRVHGPVDAVLLEGWMLGFTPVPREAIVEPHLQPPNQMLAAYSRWHRLIGAFVHLDAGSLDDIVRWRVDAERARRAAGAGALSDAEARDYIERFLPAYRLYVPQLRDQPWRDTTLRIPLGPDRMPVSRIALSAP